MRLTKAYAEGMFQAYTEEIRNFWGRYFWDRVAEDLERMRYKEAPASSTHHLSIPGGLFLHSVGVTHRALTILNDMDIMPTWKVLLAGLLHDVGKCGLLCHGMIRTRYASNSPGRGYFTVTHVPAFTVRDLSAIYAGKWGLPWDVIQAILTHDGLYTEQNRPYINTQNDMAKLIANADNLQSQLFETEAEAFLDLPRAPESRVEQAGLAESGGGRPILTPTYRGPHTPRLKRKIGRFKRK